MKNLRMHKLSASVGSLLLASSMTAATQAALLEEVVVTAQKREQNLQDVGISITSYNGDQLKQLGITSSADLQEMTPGLMYTEFGGSPSVSVFSLRGVAQNDFADHQESPNAVYLDGAYVSFIGGVNMAMFDVERVEVLRGPQGTLFGRNATGGLIHIISKKPTEQFEANVDLTYGSYDQLNFEGAVSGALSDNVQGRLSFANKYNNSYIDNRIGEDSGEARNYNLRGQLAFQPAEDLDILWNIRASVDDDPAVGSYNENELAYPLDPNDSGSVVSQRDAGFNLNDHVAFCQGFFFTNPAPGQDCFGNQEPDSDPYDVAINASRTFERDYYGTTLTIDKEFDGFTLTSITDYQTIDKLYLEDTDGTASTTGHFNTDQDAEQFSQELRIQGDSGDMSWQAGVYYLKIDGDYRATFDLSDGGMITTGIYSLETESYAVFGQAEYAINEQWRAIAGLRWTSDEKEIDFTGSCVDTFGIGLCDPGVVYPVDAVGLQSFSTDIDDTDYAFKAELDWLPNDDVLVFFSVSRGNKGGGFSASSFVTTNAQGFGFDPEVLTSYELGIKSSLTETIRLNASVYHYDYKDFQAFTFDRNATTIINIDSEISGAEVELIASPAEGWDMLVAASYLDATGEDVPLGVGVQRDQDMGLSPEFSVSGMVRKAWSAFGGTMAVQIDAVWVDERFLSVVNKPAELMEAYDKWDARVSYTSGDDKWSVALFVDNIGDEEIEAYRFDENSTNGTVITALGKPRWAGITASYRWD